MRARDASAGSGHLTSSAGCLAYSFPGGRAWTLRMSDLAVVGEYTTADGPTLDDYFFVFVTRDSLVHEASFYSAGRDEALAALSEDLGADVLPALQGSTDLASRILWPESLPGRSLYDFREVSPPGRWRWLRRILRWPHVERSLTAPVLAELAAAGREGPGSVPAP